VAVGKSAMAVGKFAAAVDRFDRHGDHLVYGIGNDGET
jgi:hypothetical protein